MQLVSIIIPCFNEQKTIGTLLYSLLEQTYPREKMEVIIADGLSTDNTMQEIKKFQEENPSLKVILVDNPKQIIPSGLNMALKASQGDFIVRIDAHSLPYPNYVEDCVEILKDGLAEIVGGVWEILPGADTRMAEAIARSASLPIAVGDALYRHSHKPGYVETVPFGAFKRELLALIGFFNEDLLVNEDYEFNSRLLKSGGRIWLDPRIRSKYFARPTLSKLLVQYGRYGFWKWQMLRKNLSTLRLRQALPPLFVFSLLISILVTSLYNPLWFIPVGILGIYSLLLVSIGLIISINDKKASFVISIPVVIASMHFTWGGGFLWSMIIGNLIRKRQKVS